MARKRKDVQCVVQGEGSLGGRPRRQDDAQLATKFSVHTNQVSAWKKQLLEGVPELFADQRGRKDETSAAEEELYEQIGRLKMEVEWLKKKSAELE